MAAAIEALGSAKVAVAGVLRSTFPSPLLIPPPSRPSHICTRAYDLRNSKNLLVIAATSLAKKAQ